MNLSFENLLRDSFGRPKGLLGKLGGPIMARANRASVAWVIKLLAVKPGDCVLEIGFGPGVGLELLVREAPRAKFSGVDISEEMLRQAMARNRAAVDRGQVELRLGYAEHLPFPDGAFDKAFSVNSLQVWTDPTAGLREARRVLKDGGTIAFGFTRHSGRPKDGLIELFEKVGFAAVRIVDGDECFCVLANCRKLKP
ncbi:MAG: methyltransferase domain-containing protein [Hyphomicrobiales bacterium]|nr:MAG: methyltransferase domain-containing protein [Hyphomicrobiales bacterium]